MIRSLGVHLIVLAVASGFAVRGWLASDKPKDDTKVAIWSAKPEQVERIEYTAKDRHVLLTASSDALGRFYLGEVDKEVDSEPPSPHHPKSPDNPEMEDEAEEDKGGAPSADPAKTPDAPKPHELKRFVAVKDAGKLAERLADLKALRILGKVDPAKFADFGFDTPEPPHVKVLLAGSTRELIFGGKTPGGQDIYARSADGEQAYVLDGQIARDLESADTHLLERSLHEWEDDEAVRVKITLGDASRELGRNAEKKQTWADPKTPDAKDETAVNWMDKLERLRVTEYEEPSQPAPTVLFTVEYFSDKGKSLGRLEVASRQAGTPEPDAKPEYFGRTEYTRWWGKLVQSTAEQLAQDASGLVHP
ncbi:MAG TPA: DUF4340 domain-containing protein [Polyangiaceae bacterium]|jgi:hypothetical protein|nr:DUF4340 domain-containing protein [Polyangiaceae bacterium]